jgi:hypothetical protein
MDVACEKQSIRHIDGPIGVAGRNSDNRLIRERLGWGPKESLRDGIAKTYPWVEKQVALSAGIEISETGSEEETQNVVAL